MLKLIHWMRKRDFSYLYALLGESTLGLMFVLYVIIARVVGPERYGVFSAAVALGGILGVFIQFGLPVLLTRSVAADPEQGSRNTLRFLCIQTLHTVPILAILPVLTHLLGFSREGIILCYIMIAAELCRSIKMSWRGIMKGCAWFKIESVSVFLERFVTVIFAGVILYTTQNLILTAAAIVLARLMDNAGTALYIGKRFPLAHSRQIETWSQTYRRALPFALHGLLWVVYYQVDMIMLKTLAPEAAEVGFYGAAYRVMEIFGSLPRVVFYVSFTHFAKCHVENPVHMPVHIYKALRMLFLLILPCLVVAGFLQPIAMPILLGRGFDVSITLLAILLPGLSINVFSTLCGEYLLATERENQLPPLLFAVSICNIVINAILIPRHGAMGAAIATVISEAVFCCLGMVLLFRSPIRKTTIRVIQFILPCLLIAATPSLFYAGIPLKTAVPLLLVGVGASVILMPVFARFAKRTASASAA